MTVRKICVLGLGNAGVPLSAVIALKCPEIRVTIAMNNSEDVFQWNTGRISPSVNVPGLEDFIRKCQNKNLFFTTNDSLAIKEAEIIFIMSESQQKAHGEGKNEVVDLSRIEEAAYLIAEHAESNKIVVENSSIPLKAAECVKNVLTYNRKPGVEFQVLSNPGFYTQGSSIKSLLLPDCVMIGSENTPQGTAAAKKVHAIYQRWVPPKNIVMQSNWTIELSKLCLSAMIAQTLVSAYTMAAVCEESGANVADLFTVLPNQCGAALSSPEFAFNVAKFSKDLRNLIYMYEWLDLTESADYWREVLEICNYTRQKFLQKFLWTLQGAAGRKIAILGFASYRDTEVTEGSMAIDLCRAFVEENALINIYDPRVSQKQVIAELISAGCKASEEHLTMSIIVSEDPYKAAYRSQVIVACEIWPEFGRMDYERIYAGMIKPAYVFDRRQCLPHEELSRIGFNVQTVGKFN